LILQFHAKGNATFPQGFGSRTVVGMDGRVPSAALGHFGGEAGHFCPALIGVNDSSIGIRAENSDWRGGA
jgi:hypothetical protein